MSSLFSYFPQFTGPDSLFSKMVALGAPWSEEQGRSMDISYFTMWSGISSPSGFTRIHSTDGIADSQLIAKVLWDIYGQNWQKLWDAFQSEYNPIDNYNVDETIDRTQTDDRTIDKSGTLDSTVDGTLTQTVKEIVDSTGNNYGTVKETGKEIVDSTIVKDETIKQTGKEVVDSTVEKFGTVNVVESTTGQNKLQHGETISTQGETDNFAYGFNTVTKVPREVDTTTGTEGHSGTDTTDTTSNLTRDTTTHNVDDIDNTTSTTMDSTNHNVDDIDTTTTTTRDSDSHNVDIIDSTTDTTLNQITGDTRKDSTKENTTDNDSLKEDIIRKRSGNVGQNSYQELLAQEFDLWKWNFFEQVFQDVDKFLIIPIFDPCSLVN